MTKQLQRLERTSDLEYQRDAQEHAMEASAIANSNLERLGSTPGLWHSLLASEAETPDDPDEKLPYWLDKAVNCQIAANQAIYQSGRLLDIACESHGGSNNEFLSSKPRGLSRATCYAHWSFYKLIVKLRQQAISNVARHCATDPNADLTMLIPPERAFNRSSKKVGAFIEAWFKGVDLDAETMTTGGGGGTSGEGHNSGSGGVEPPRLGHLRRSTTLTIAKARRLPTVVAQLEFFENMANRAGAARSALYSALDDAGKQALLEAKAAHDIEPGWEDILTDIAEQARYCDDKEEGRKVLLQARKIIDDALVAIDTPDKDPSDPTPTEAVGDMGCPTPLDNLDTDLPGLDDEDWDDEDDDLARAIEGDRS